MKKIILLVSLITVMSASVCTQEIINDKKVFSDKLKLSSRSNTEGLLINDKISQKENLLPLAPQNKLLNELKISEQDFSINEINAEPRKKKSIGLGILLSALVPGAGEFYGKSYIKAGIFFAVELIAWGTYFYFNKKGDDKTADFQAFADVNWDVRRYARWLNDQFQAGVDPNAEKEALRQQINAFESTHFSHTLPPYSSQQYYELIGKYQNFMGGWADAESNGNWFVTSSNYFTYQTSMFKGYSVDRQDANDFYDNATIGPIVAIVNHLLSAADAAWVISTYNSKIKVETGLRMQNRISPYTYKFVQVPTLNVSVGF